MKNNLLEVPGGLSWFPDGRFLVVTMLNRRLLRLDSDGLTVVADLSKMIRKSFPIRRGGET
ncbi:MAG: hypothetical protein IMZ58_03540 [Thermoplasmata archaeon]|nr:hypothetical protein [Thermoplasmata archaeon]